MACPLALRRTLRRGAYGKDVLGIKYGLRKAGYGRGLIFTKRFGLAMRYNVRRFQRSRGLRVDGLVGLNTYRRLRTFVPPYGCWLLNHYQQGAPKRSQIVATALFAREHSSSIHYTQSALRMYGVRNHIRPPGIPRYEDCSSFATWCYWVAGAPDPNGRGYDGYGYTGTLTKHGRQIQPAFCRPGDLVFYGGSYWVPGHVAVYTGNGLVVSHGSESGPQFRPISYRPITQARSYLP
jgi:hypothetical protein